MRCMSLAVSFRLPAPESGCERLQLLDTKMVGSMLTISKLHDSQLMQFNTVTKSWSLVVGPKVMTVTIRKLNLELSNVQAKSPTFIVCKKTLNFRIHSEIWDEKFLNGELSDHQLLSLKDNFYDYGMALFLVQPNFCNANVVQTIDPEGFDSHDL